jgi:hypothetical protein
MVKHLDSPGHSPGTLPDCPACDIEYARQAYVVATRGQCPAEQMEMLDKPGKRLVEVALNTQQIAREKGIPARDALHQQSVNDKVKATVAEWVCPENTDDFTGTIENRMKARQENDDRARERINDQVLEIVAGLDPEDWSLHAMQARETAASIRDHRANAANQRAWSARAEERVLLEEARAMFDEKDENIRLMHQAHEAKQYGWQATYRDRAKQLDQRGEVLVFAAIELGNRARIDELDSSNLLRDNEAYDRDRKARGF